MQNIRFTTTSSLTNVHDWRLGCRVDTIRTPCAPWSQVARHFTACKWCRRGRRGPWWRKTSTPRCPPWWKRWQGCKVQMQRRTRSTNSFNDRAEDRKRSEMFGSRPRPLAPNQETTEIQMILLRSFAPLFIRKHRKEENVSSTNKYRWWRRHTFRRDKQDDCKGYILRQYPVVSLNNTLQ